MRHVTSGCVAAKKLWSWLKPFDANIGYERESRQQFDALIKNDTSLRRAVQRLVLLEQSGEQNPWQRQFCLREHSTSFLPTPEDVIALLETLDPEDRNDERWRDVIRLTQHHDEAGAEVRTAARPFAAHRPDLLQWINKLATPDTPQSQIDEDNRKRRQRAKQAAQHALQRQNYSARTDQMSKGDASSLINPAKVYLKLFSDINGETPAHQRVHQWLGEDIGDIALFGFLRPI